MPCYLLPLIYFSNFVLSHNSNPVVNTTYGPIEGFYQVLENGVHANIFLGIPFAFPPIGDQRFEKPKPPEKWTHFLNTDKFRPACIPSKNQKSLLNYSEDCLYLNIFAPSKKKKSHEEFPVLVWIHGGQFSLGGAEKYGYTKLVENFVSEGIIVVTLQYRLGLLGFLSLSDDFNDSEANWKSELPGNLGLYDIQAALIFLIENIEYFGGNSFDITLMGSGAGSAAIDALMITPKTDYLFQKTIELSNPTQPFQWANPHENLNYSKNFITSIGCAHENEKLIKKCLKNTRPDDECAKTFAQITLAHIKFLATEIHC